MDSTRFDSLARVVGAWTTRRSALALLAGLGLGSLDAAQTTARKSGTCKPACTECTTCKKGKCKKRNGTKRCKKGTCEPLTAGTPCTVPSGGGACCGGVCVDTQSDKANCGACGTACTANEVCQAGVCFPKAACPATQTGLCTPAITQCSVPPFQCVCGQSTAGNSVCVSVAGIVCAGPSCTDSPTCPSCAVDADCAAGFACLDASGDACGCQAGFRVCLPPCPVPIPAREARTSEATSGGLLAP